jgi:hypothetical protein
MDFNDDLAGIQVGGIIPPSALAVAESVGASGKDVIASIVIGYDVATRCAMAINSQGLYMRGLQPTAIWPWRSTHRDCTCAACSRRQYAGGSLPRRQPVV